MYGWKPTNALLETQMIAYPVDIPSAEIRDTVSRIFARDFTDKAALAKNIWIIQGFAQKQVFGERQILAGMALKSNPWWMFWAPEPALTDDEAATHLRSLIVLKDGEDATQVMNAVPWISILKWTVKILVKLLV